MSSGQPFVLIKGSKSRGGEWSPDDYDVRDSHGKVVGRGPLSLQRGYFKI
jgi:hypothetical protein